MKGMEGVSAAGTSMEDDLFFDLFGENDLLTPDSIAGSSDPDSGFGSPFGSRLGDLSPLQLPNYEENELLDSILDDIPDEVIDDDSDSNVEQQPSWVHQLMLDDDQPVADMFWFMKDVEKNQICDNMNEGEDTLLSDSWGFLDDLMIHKPHKLTPHPTNHSTSSLIISNSCFDSDGAMEANIGISSSGTNDSVASTFVRPSKIPDEHATALSFQNSSVVQDMLRDAIAGPNAATTASEIHLMSNALDKKSTSEAVTNGNIGAHISIEHDYAGKRSSSPATGTRKGLGGGIVLTEEEKNILKRESTTLPENLPLTKDEEKVLKRVRRKIKNKQSAMESRRRRKDYMYNLEKRVKHCTDVNNDLNRKVDELDRENKTLISELKVLKEYCKLIKEAGRINPSSCLAIMLFSFALFILPFSPLHYSGKSDYIGDIPTKTTFRSRTLLSIPSGDDAYQDLDSSFSTQRDNDLVPQASNKISILRKNQQVDHKYMLNHNNITLLVLNNASSVYSYTTK